MALTCSAIDKVSVTVIAQQDTIQAQEVHIASGHSEALRQQQSRITLELTTVAYCLDLQEASRCLQRVGHSKLVKLLSPTSTSNK